MSSKLLVNKVKELVKRKPFKVSIFNKETDEVTLVEFTFDNGVVLKFETNFTGIRMLRLISKQSTVEVYNNTEENNTTLRSIEKFLISVSTKKLLKLIKPAIEQAPSNFIKDLNSNKEATLDADLYGQHHTIHFKIVPSKGFLITFNVNGKCVTFVTRDKKLVRKLINFSETKEAIAFIDSVL